MLRNQHHSCIHFLMSTLASCLSYEALAAMGSGCNSRLFRIAARIALFTDQCRHKWSSPYGESLSSPPMSVCLSCPRHAELAAHEKLSLRGLRVIPPNRPEQKKQGVESTGRTFHRMSTPGSKLYFLASRAFIRAWKRLHLVISAVCFIYQ